MELDTQPRTVAINPSTVVNFKRLSKACDLASDKESRLENAIETILKGRAKREANILLPRLALVLSTNWRSSC